MSSGETDRHTVRFGFVLGPDAPPPPHPCPRRIDTRGARSLDLARSRSISISIDLDLDLDRSQQNGGAARPVPAG